jgi:hypothetical protein
MSPYLEKQTKAKRAGNMAHMVKHLPSKCKDLSSIFSTTEKENIKMKSFKKP